MKTLFALFVLTLIIAVVPINADTDAELNGRITSNNNKVLNDARQDLMQNREEYGLTKDDIDGIMQHCENVVDRNTEYFLQYYNAYFASDSSQYNAGMITPEWSGCFLSELPEPLSSVDIIQVPEYDPDLMRRIPWQLLGISCAIQAAQAEQACLKKCMDGLCITGGNVWECQLECSQVGLEVFLACIGLSRQTTTTTT